ncbi:hypothetical protein QYF36_006717 [Acer negundo]|nr:hypothetical protein QYF36_006717 [Acer negundo]
MVAMSSGLTRLLDPFGARSWDPGNSLVESSTWPHILLSAYKSQVGLPSSLFRLASLCCNSSVNLCLGMATGRVECAGEVEEPQRTYPKAFFFAGLLTCLAYLIPLLAATGAVTLDQENWVDGYFADVAQLIAGKWLKMCRNRLGMLLEFASFLWLRRKLPTLKRPFRVPLELPGLVVLCLVPSGFLAYVMVWLWAPRMCTW